MTLIIYFIGHSSGFIYYYFTKEGSAGGGALAKTIYHLFPNFEALDSSVILTSYGSTSLDIEIKISIMIIYTIVMIIIGTMIVRRQEL
jgi:ABC-type multidrug transport system permease subunit